MQPHRLNIYALRSCTKNARFCRSLRAQAEAYRGPGCHPATWMVVTACGIWKSLR
jgi:hypothetical protein